MERTWTEVGKEHTATKEQEIGAILDRMEWQTIPCTMGAMQGMGIKEAVKQLGIPKVSHVADSHELAPLGLLGIKGEYSNGKATVYLVDEGISVVVIATDFYPN